MNPAPIVDALGLAEDAIKAALAALAPTGNAHWDGAPVDTDKALRGYVRGEAGGLSRVFVAQHQDGGGRQRERLNERSWSGLVVVRVLSADDAEARAGLALVAAALAALAPPTGYTLGASYDRPIRVPPSSVTSVNPLPIYTRAAQWQVTIRRSA